MATPLYLTYNLVGVKETDVLFGVGFEKALSSNIMYPVSLKKTQQLHPLPHFCILEKMMYLYMYMSTRNI